MNLLLHICCAPCAIYPVRILRERDVAVTGYFYNPNIHPFSEFARRRQTLAGYSESIGLRTIWPEGYDLERFLRSVAFREAERCRYCYYDRLRSTALAARDGQFDGFSSTLLYSRFQKHDLIREIGEAVGRETGVSFYYEDFRTGWKEGVEKSKQLQLYRQQYCGCVYSEKERYYRGKEVNR
ncbi:MAG: epoxyqueuosine reductase QueH [Thermodesulfobacteriota bacterium]